MMRLSLILLASAFLASAFLPTVSAAADTCIPCGPVDNVCYKVLHFHCLDAKDGDSTSPVACINCDEFNRVCQKLWGVNCLG